MTFGGIDFWRPLKGKSDWWEWEDPLLLGDAYWGTEIKVHVDRPDKKI